MNLIPINSPSFVEPELLTSMPDWGRIFGNDKPLALEIGSGMGDFVAQMAVLHPDRNFIALDYYNKGCLRTCKRIDTMGLDNVRVVRDEARSFMVRCIPQGSLCATIINCPDPWPKMRHRKRRLVNADFMQFLSGYLQQSADFHFATDFDDYGLDVAHMMGGVPAFTNVLPEPYQHELQGYPLSKYMLKFMAEGKKIYFIHYRKV
ncbi:tRNA (guanine-N(7)-)-methyltransferase [Geobacter sp. SVR]|nr:tRNA (guanine-N(7)-)-methyltransferase [Geobacter sp. SVR]GCF86066.1 tRNA (guanine-N(7)-)-methyltransferase [Geobacter sp. SVR]